jgi:hypothetical protein
MIDPPSSYKYEKNKFIRSMILHLHIKIVNENIFEVQIFSITLKNDVPCIYLNISSVSHFKYFLNLNMMYHIFLYILSPLILNIFLSSNIFYNIKNVLPCIY